MVCQKCGKDKQVTLRRYGGLIDGQDKPMQEYTAVCLPCVKRRMSGGGIAHGPIVTNPTIKPSGNPLEWVIND